MWIKLDQWPSQFENCDECGSRDTPLLANHGRFLCVHHAREIAVAFASIGLTEREYATLRIRQLQEALVAARADLEGLTAGSAVA